MKTRYTFTIFFSAVIQILHVYTYCIQLPEKFKHYSIADGLTQGRIICIMQDHVGYLWIGTNNGLNKFDGYSFTNYQSDENDTTALFGRRVTSIYEDAKNRLWIGCTYRGGLHLYNRDKDSFTRFLKKMPPNEQAAYHEVTSIAEGDNNLLWLGTTNGLIKFNAETSSQEAHYKNTDNSSRAIGGTLIQSLCVDTYNNVWIGFNGQGVDCFNPQTEKSVHFVYDETNPNSLSNNVIFSIFHSSCNNILAGTRGGGLNIIVPHYNNSHFIDAGEVKFYRIKNNKPNNNSLSSDYVNHIYEDIDNTIWISTDNGLNKLNGKLSANLKNNAFSFAHIQHNPQDNESLNYNFVRCSYVDKSGVVWAGTNTGLNKSKNQKFSHYKQQAFGSGLLSNKVQAFCEDKNGDIWIGTSKGTTIFNPKHKDFKTVLPGVEAIMDILEDNKGNMWFATWEDGLLLYNSQNQSYKQVYQSNTAPENIHTQHLSAVAEDCENNIWIAVWGWGLVKYNKESEEIFLLERDVKIRNTNCFFFDSNKTFWIGSLEGLVYSKRDNENSYSSFQEVRDKDNVIQTKYITCITEGISGDIWFGTMKGLYNLQVIGKDTIISAYTKKEGLPSNEIMGIVPDNSGNFWISSLNGLSKMRVPKSEHEKLQIKNYNVEHGVQGTEFVIHSYLKSKTGDIYFGGTNGFNVFNPNEIIDNKYEPHVILTGFSLYNKSIHSGDTIDGEVILKQSVSSINQITLPHDKNFFSFHFAALHFTAPESNKYKYKLEGFDNAWNFIGTENKVTFIGLKPDDYTLKIKAANSDGIWSSTPLEIDIRILPPWWETVWARMLIVVFMFSSLIMIVRIRTLNLKNQKQKLEKTVAERTTQLREMNQVLFSRQDELEQQAKELLRINSDLEAKTIETEQMAKQLHETDQKQLRFFANISHEFRTPLTLIMGPLEKLLKTGRNQEWGYLENQMMLMHRNSKRLFRLINQLLDFRKLDHKARKTVFSNNNIVEFVQEIVKAFGAMAEAKKIHLSLDKNHLPFTIENFSKNIDHSTLKIENLTEKSIRASDEIFENNNLSNEKDQMINDKCKMINDFWFDPDIIEKILYNLISNALKYTPEGGEILIAIGIVETRLISSLRYQLVINISDTGIGIDVEEQNKIFDRFYRSETQNIKEQKGIGIGLAYTKELIELHNGNISVESEKNKGSIFTIAFPINDKHDTNTESEPQTIKLEYTKSMILETSYENATDTWNDSAVKQKKLNEIKREGSSNKILVVEDNEDMQKYISSELSDTFTVCVANNGQQGLDIAVKEMPDLIISDVMMPGMDGIQLCEKLKQDVMTSHIPIILLTAKTGDENTIQGLRTGADEYLQKPFHTEILRLKIYNLLNVRQLLREKYDKSFKILPKEFSPTSIDEVFLQRAIEVVENNISDPDFTTERFSTLLGYGRTMAHNKIKSLTGKPVSDFIKKIRLEHAANLIEEGKKNIKEIAVLTGFKYRESFYRAFTAMYGVSPTQYSKTHSP